MLFLSYWDDDRVLRIVKIGLSRSHGESRRDSVWYAEVQLKPALVLSPCNNEFEADP